jgi:hypothetical protein
MDSMTVSLHFTPYNHGVPSFFTDAGKSSRIVWMAVSVAILVVLALPFTPACDPVIGLIPACEWKTRYGRECPFCGMTTSFLDISEGHLDAAHRVNRAGIPL